MSAGADLGGPPPVTIDQICDRFALGPPHGAPEPVSGGLLHRVWRLETTQGRFAIKELNQEAIGRPGARQRCRLSERVARAMADAGIPAVAALDADGGPLFDAGGRTVLVYPWVEGRRLPPGPAPPDQAHQIGALLGRMHRLRLALPGPEPIVFSAVSEDRWRRLIERAAALGLPWAEEARAALPDLLAWNARCVAAGAALAPEQVVSHRDLDPKNVLWRADGSPVVLDWEAAGCIPPALELAGAALDWGGQHAGEPERASVAALLAGYRAEVGALPGQARAALAGQLGNQLDWLLYSMERAVGSGPATEEQEQGARQTRHVLGTLRALAANLERWAAWFEEEAP